LVKSSEATNACLILAFWGLFLAASSQNSYLKCINSIPSLFRKAIGGKDSRVPDQIPMIGNSECSYFREITHKIILEDSLLVS